MSVKLLEPIGCRFCTSTYICWKCLPPIGQAYVDNMTDFIDKVVIPYVQTNPMTTLTNLLVIETRKQMSDLINLLEFASFADVKRARTLLTTLTSKRKQVFLLHMSNGY